MLEMVNMSGNNLISSKKAEKEEERQLKFQKSEEVEVKQSLLSEENNKEEDQLTLIQKYNALKQKYELLKKIIKEFLGLIIFCVVYIYYYLSLETCLLGQEKCSLLVEWQMDKIHQVLRACFIAVFLLELIFYKLLSKLHLIHFFIVFSVFYKKSHGRDFDDHGYYNFMYFFIIVFLTMILLIPFNLIVSIYHKTKNFIFSLTYALFLLLIISSLYYFIIVNRSNCDDWGKGLNNTSIDNNSTKYACQIQYPKKCTYKAIYFFQDYTKILKKNCSKMTKENLRENLLKVSKSSFINSSTKHFGYPLSNKDPKSIEEERRDTLLTNFFNNLVDMEDENTLENYFKNKIPEVSVYFNNDTQGKININVHYDDNLSKERKLLEKDTIPLSNNVFIIYIDSVSRQNSIRELKNTLKFFEKFMPYEGGFNKNNPNDRYHSFQFFKYHSFNGYTSVNYPILFYGQKREEKNKFLINKYFKENGFVTCLSHDSCLRDNTKSNHNYIEEEVFDHEFNLCDPNKDNINRNTIRCLYGKQDIEHLLNYTDQFWRKYKDNRKFALLVSNYGHEGSLQPIKYIDLIISDFLNNLFNENLLKDTTLFLMSDHGTGMPSLYYISDFYKIEIHLPMLYILVNDRKNVSYEQQYKYMYENQQNFITAFDFYNTLGNIIFGDKYKDIKNKTEKEDTCKSPLGQSLFDKINDIMDRHPKKFDKIIGMNLDTCK